MEVNAALEDLKNKRFVATITIATTTTTIIIILIITTAIIIMIIIIMEDLKSKRFVGRCVLRPQ